MTNHQDHLQKARILSLALLAFFNVASYSISRPAIESLFLKDHSSSALPTVWILTAIATALAMSIYNRFNTRYSLLKVFGASALLSAFSLGVLVLGAQNAIPGTSFLLYIWKEIYVVILSEIFWSFADTVFDSKSAKRVYGLLLAVGSIGGLTGSLIVGQIAKIFGTAGSLWTVIPILIASFLTSTVFARYASEEQLAEWNNKKQKNFDGSLQVIWKSQYLLPLLFLIVVVQITITLIDFEFNNTLQFSYPDVDQRTDILGKVHAAIDIVALFLQLTSSFIFRMIGVSGTLFCIPICLMGVVIGALTVPHIAMMFTLKVASKCFDYSLFRASKEILYIPLSRLEKTKGKAFIDILIYRLSKGFSSLLLLALSFLSASNYVLEVALILQIIWIFLTHVITKRYRTIIEGESL